MKLFYLLHAVCVYLILPASALHAASARFWLSTSPVSPTIVAPTFNSVMGTQHYLYIWPQPQTDGQAHFKTLQNFSLNLQPAVDPASSSVIDFLDGTYTIFNPQVPTGGGTRFEHISDSH